MENIEICCSHNVGIDGKDFTPECDCSCHQPIEKKCHTAPMKKCKICKMDYCPECFEFCPMCPQPAVSDQHQKETATPDKQDGCCFCPCDCHQEKLPTSSYEVTCGRCEKSIKHSCGRV